MAVKIESETDVRDMCAYMCLFNEFNKKMLCTLSHGEKHISIDINKEQAFQISKHLIIEFNLVFK